MNYEEAILAWLKKPLFQTAFTHRSYLNEARRKLESNERLEFLGDAVLSFVVSSYIYRLKKEAAEGELTSLRSYIVKTPSLAQVANKLFLGQYLKLSKGEQASGGRDNPQLLANTYEALLGAIFLDQGIEAASTFIQQTLLPLFEEELKKGPPKDAKSLLQELTQNQTKQSPKYKIIATTGPDHAKEFTVAVYLQGRQVGLGKGLSKQVAEEAAASEALKTLSHQ